MIAGDIYDTTYPSKETIHLFENAIHTINIDMNIPMIISNGNHDGKND